MKLRILLVPFFLVLAIGLIVWLVMPRYYDDKLKRQNFKMETDKLDTAMKKVEKVNLLMADLGANADKQAILFSFLPEAQKEEEVINDLNNIASAESIAIKNLSTVKSSASSPASVSPEISGANAIIAVSSFNVDFTVVGTYDRIKNVIDRLSKIKRFNNISSLAIDNENSEEVSGNNLQAKMILTFNYFKKTDAVSVGGDVFSQDKFDMSVIEKINSSRITDTAKITNISGGRENPFLP